MTCTHILTVTSVVEVDFRKFTMILTGSETCESCIEEWVAVNRFNIPPPPINFVNNFKNNNTHTKRAGALFINVIII